MPRFNRILLIQALLLLMPLGILVALGAYAWTVHQRAEGKLAEVEPRHARLEGMLQAQANIAEMGQAVSASLSRFVFPAERPVTEVGNEVLQAVRAAMVESRLDVQSIQIQAAKEGKTFDRIPIALRMEGETAALQAAMSRLATLSPVVLVDSFSLNLVGIARPAASPRLAIQLNLSILKGKS